MHKPGPTLPSLQATRALELKHLRSAVAAADCGSFRGAAELLGPQQSSLSRIISEFEHHLGVPIFERFSGGVRPTRPGRDVLRLARTILEEFGALIATARSVHNSETGRLSVGFCTSLSAGNLQASLLDFKQRSRRARLLRLNDHGHV
ncbi:LysR family transcriptional regulator [Bradyrhizobium sp. 38]|uniref:LysR family transcriptional regulator n=1 Tax=unclassified Bradyrhizobium TaxID=2631580 RepID=UPI001FF93F8F|nr:LysR family transcriptional regulator [Bradyrhizobium sp. 38]